ncbi:hypothetical protein AEAC466_20285 [Asticcacaulis sp. AC466]|nr:hypothetical protein AEAC466_20285 [Asticcacaulis sp. AC466]
MGGKMNNLRERLQVYRDRHDHEWVLLSGRINTLMTSQSFLIAACAALYVNRVGNEHSSGIIAMIASVAILLCFMASLVIVINCRVILDWHIEANRLYKEDMNRDLAGYYIPRDQADFRHILTTDIFSTLIPLSLGFLWLEALCLTLEFSPLQPTSWPVVGSWGLPNSNQYWVAIGMLTWAGILFALHLFTSLHSRKRRGGASAA